jgi:hypothetical protein
MSIRDFDHLAPAIYGGPSPATEAALAIAEANTMSPREIAASWARALAPFAAAPSELPAAQRQPAPRGQQRPGAMSRAEIAASWERAFAPFVDPRAARSRESGER